MREMEEIRLAAGIACCLAIIGCAAALVPPWRRPAEAETPVRAVIAEALVCPVGAPLHPWTHGSVVTSDHSEAALRRVVDAFAAEGRPLPVYGEGGAWRGWCVGLRVDATGLWARAALTPRGAKEAREGGGIYLNPTFEEFVDGHTATGTPRRLMRLRLAAEPTL